MLGLWLALAISASPETAEIELTAERTLHDGQRELTTAEGQATLVTEDAAVNADRIVYDKLRNVATATGNVVARLTKGGKIAVVADLMTLKFDDAHEVREVFLFDGQAISKKDVKLEVFLAADTAEKVERAGTTQALLQGNHLVRDGSKWTVEELDLVPCECDFKNPSWSITSTTATVDTEAERVAITNPVIRIKHVPVLWLPWLSLPLTERASGLLFPRPSFWGQNGFSLEQPVFVTLGRSADLTLTPGFFTGATARDPRTGAIVGNGVAGPKLGTEFRYVASTRATGRIVLGLLYDFRTRRDVENPALREAGSVRGWRGELAWQHTQDFDHGFGARVDFNGHSDGDYNRDLTVDVIASSATYLRSSATAFHRGADHYVSLDVGLRQDIQWGYDWMGNGTLLDAQTPSRRTVGQFGPGTLQRLPVVTFGWTPTSTLGPVRFSLEAEASRLAPLFSDTGDEGSGANEGAIERTPFKVAVDRLFSPSASTVFGRNGIGNRLWNPGEREARDRLMIMPRLSISGQPLGLFSASLSAAWRQFGWAGEASGRTWSRGYLLLGGLIETEVSRSFAGGSLRHVIQPRAELRAVSLGLQGSSGSDRAPKTTAPVAYDQLDFAVPDVTPRFQGVLELRQRLMGAGGVEHLRLELGQGFELSGPDYAHLTPTLGEAFGRLTVRVGWVSAQGLLRVDPIGLLRPLPTLPGVAAVDPPLWNDATGPRVREQLGTFGALTSRVGGRLDLDDGRGHGAYAAYENLLMEGTARSRQPIDLLFLIDRGFTSTTRVQQLVFGARWDFGPVGVRYDALVMEQRPAGSVAPVLTFTQQTLGIGFTPACDCWRVDLTANQSVYPVPVFPNLGFSVSVSRFGSIGVR